MQVETPFLPLGTPHERSFLSAFCLIVPSHLPLRWDESYGGEDALSAGDLDWARLAMFLWPERVIPKCAADRSLAAVHGLEATFWIEGSDGKWQRRETPTQPVADLIQQRSRR